MAARSEMGYVDSPALGLPGEPEAVSEEEQMALTEQARRKVLDARIARREVTSEEIERELVHLEGRCKYLRRQLKRLQR